MWKLIMYASDSYTRDFHHLNDVVLWQDILQFLQSRNQFVPWYPLFLTFFSSFSFVLINSFILRVLLLRNKNYRHAFFLLVLSSVAFMPNLLWIHQNRTAFIMSGAGLLLSLYPHFFTYSSSFKKQLLSAFGVLWFFGGVCFRPEAGFASFILFIPFYFFVTRQVSSLLRLSPHFILLVGFFLTYQWNIWFNPTFYYQLEPDVEYQIVDNRNVIPLSAMQNARDSARYKAVADEWMLADVKQTTPAFIKSLICDKKTQSCRADDGKSGSMLNREFIRLIVWENLFALFSILLLFVISCRSRYIILFLLLFGFSFMAISFSVNIYLRVVQPMLFLICTFLIIFLVRRKANILCVGTRKALNVLIFSALFLFCLSFSKHYDQSVQMRVTQNQIRSRLKQVLQVHKDRRHIVITGDFTPFNTGAFSDCTDFEGRKILITEFGQFSGNPAFLYFGAKQSGCDSVDFLCKMKYIENIKGDVILFASKRKLFFYNKYLRDVYGFTWGLTGTYHHLADDSYAFLPDDDK